MRKPTNRCPADPPTPHGLNHGPTAGRRAPALTTTVQVRTERIVEDREKPKVRQSVVSSRNEVPADSEREPSQSVVSRHQSRTPCPPPPPHTHHTRRRALLQNLRVNMSYFLDHYKVPTPPLWPIRVSTATGRSNFLDQCGGTRPKP
jgi:hypothetical protein